MLRLYYFPSGNYNRAKLDIYLKVLSALAYTTIG